MVEEKKIVNLEEEKEKQKMKEKIKEKLTEKEEQEMEQEEMENPFGFLSEMLGGLFGGLGNMGNPGEGEDIFSNLTSMINQNVEVKVYAKNKKYIPEYKTKGSAGFDFRACLDEKVVLKPGERKLIDTGLKMEIPEGFELQIRPRSGLAIKHGITVLNSPGTIDSDYRGPIGVILINHGSEDFEINDTDRIAQGILAKVERAEFEIVDKEEDLEKTDRGEGGFGSTGKE